MRACVHVCVCLCVLCVCECLSLPLAAICVCMCARVCGRVRVRVCLCVLFFITAALFLVEYPLALIARPVLRHIYSVTMLENRSDKQSD